MKLRNLFLSPGGQLVYAALQEPANWSKDHEYTVTHKPSGFTFWVANNMFHPYRPTDVPEAFSWIEQRILQRQYRRMQRLSIFQKLIDSRMQ